MPDDDLEREERAFRDAFQRQAEGYRLTRVNPYAPPQRPWWPTWVAVAAVLVVIAGGLGVLFSRSMDHGQAVASTPPGNSVASCVADCVPTSLPPASAGWHWVSWHNVAAQAPNSWGWGWTPYGFCVDGSGPTTPYVDLNDSLQISGDVACGYPGAPHDVPAQMQEATGGIANPAYWRPLLSFYAQSPYEKTMFIPRTGSWSYRGWRMVKVARSGVYVTILDRTADEATMSRIKASLTTFTTDQNGCPSSSVLQEKRPGRPKVGRTNVVSVSVCQYDRTAGLAWPGLAASRKIVGTAASRLVRAIESAPAGGGPGRASGCSGTEPSDSAIELIAHGDLNDTQRSFYVYYDGCAGNGIDDGRVVHRLTRADCAPIFSDDPVIWWSGIKKVSDVCRPNG